MTKEKNIKNIFVQGAITPAFIGDSIAKHQHKTMIGAHEIFLGQVRNDKIENREVVAIEYTAHENLANEIMHQLREDIFKEYDLRCLHVYHSLGLVHKGELCLFVFCSSAHRLPAREACAALVERIKKELPIWGKEIFDDESSQWKENK